MKVLVVGSMNVDFSYMVDALPLPGETVMAHGFYSSPGGKGANQAVAAARLGAEVAMIGRVGQDPNGILMRETLLKEGISIEGIQETATHTGNAHITIQENGLNTIVVYPGANFEVSREDIDKNRALIEEADVVVMQLEIPMDTVVYCAELCHTLGKTVILNPAPAQALSEKLLSHVSILTPNETELQFLTGKSDVKEGCQVMHGLGVKHVIVTLGDQGSLSYDGQHFVESPAFNVKALDTTAAGDAFNGALASTYRHAPQQVLEFSNAVGALTTLHKGAIPSLPHLTEVTEFISETKEKLSCKTSSLNAHSSIK